MATFSKTINAEMFIIPNGNARIKDFYVKSYQKELKNIAVLNHVVEDYDLDIDELRFIQVWITVPGKADNVMAHGIKLEDDDGNEHLCHTRMGNIPVKMVYGKKEGDMIDVIIPFYEGDEKFNVKFNIKLNQTSYRYRRFGKFEECLKELLRGQ